MYQPYSQTLAALDRFGATMTTLNMLDLEKKRQAAEHDLAMRKLGLQESQMANQNRIALAEADVQANERAQNRRFREEQLELARKEDERAGRRLTIEEDKAKQDEWMQETGNFEELYRASMKKQNMPDAEINRTIEGYRKIGSVDPVTGGTLPKDQWYGNMLLNTATTREKMFDVLNDLPRMQSAFIAAARAARGGSGGASSANERVRLNQLKGLLDTWNGAKIDSNIDSAAKKQVDDTLDLIRAEGWHITETPVQDPENPDRSVMTYGVIGFNPELAKAGRRVKFEETLRKRVPRWNEVDDSQREVIFSAIEAQGQGGLERAVSTLNTRKTPEGFTPYVGKNAKEQTRMPSGQKSRVDGVSMSAPKAELSRQDYGDLRVDPITGAMYEYGRGPARIASGVDMVSAAIPEWQSLSETPVVGPVADFAVNTALNPLTYIPFGAAISRGAGGAAGAADDVARMSGVPGKPYTSPAFARKGIDINKSWRPTTDIVPVRSAGTGYVPNWSPGSTARPMLPSGGTGYVPNFTIYRGPQAVPTPAQLKPWNAPSLPAGEPRLALPPASALEYTPRYANDFFENIVALRRAQGAF